MTPLEQKASAAFREESAARQRQDQHGRTQAMDELERLAVDHLCGIGILEGDVDRVVPALPADRTDAKDGFAHVTLAGITRFRLVYLPTNDESNEVVYGQHLREGFDGAVLTRDTRFIHGLADLHRALHPSEHAFWDEDA